MISVSGALRPRARRRGPDRGSDGRPARTVASPYGACRTLIRQVATMYSMLEYAIEVAGATGAGQDRAAVFTRGDQVLIVLADGAGGSGKGALAAETIVAAVGDAGHEDWSSLLLELEPGLGGESTAA